MKVKVILSEEKKKKLSQIFESLTKEDLLKKCVKGRTQNVNEAFNCKIWAKCPKVRLHGKDMATCAYHLAALEHNIGYAASSLIPFMKDSARHGLNAIETKEKSRRNMSMHKPSKKRKL